MWRSRIFSRKNGKTVLTYFGKERFVMKKISIALVLLCTILVGLAGSVTAFADFGSGAAAVANGVSVVRTGLRGQKIVFSDADIKAALVLTDFKSVTITKIPPSTEGTLLLGGKRVGEGRVIKRKDVPSLVFVPASSEVSESRFSFTLDGFAGGAEIECVLKFIDKVNYAPEAEDAAVVTTQEDISVFGTLGARDPEGDDIEYIVVNYPKKGSLSLTGARFCYTPKDNYTGSDKFTYVARDEYGNYSEPVTVKLKVTDRMCETVYADMSEREEYNAAVAMTAMNIMGGHILGDDVYFMPDEKVTRAEFVAMAMKAVGVKADSTLYSTFFDDDSQIPEGLRGYVSTAQRIGIIEGDFKDGKLLFRPNEEITHYEAAKMLASLVNAENEGEESVFASDDNVPVWARSSIAAMCALGVFDGSEDMTASLTRADTAKILYKAIK